MSRLYPIGGAFTLEDARKGVDDEERNVYQPILLLQPAQREAHRHRGKARDELICGDRSKCNPILPVSHMY